MGWALQIREERERVRSPSVIGCSSIDLVPSLTPVRTRPPAGTRCAPGCSRIQDRETTDRLYSKFWLMIVRLLMDLDELKTRSWMLGRWRTQCLCRNDDKQQYGNAERQADMISVRKYRDSHSVLRYIADALYPVSTHTRKQSYE